MPTKDTNPTPDKTSKSSPGKDAPQPSPTPDTQPRPSGDSLKHQGDKLREAVE